MVFHPQDAEEVTQEVLIKAITRLSTFQGKGHYQRVIGSKHIVRSLNNNCDVPTSIFLFPSSLDFSHQPGLWFWGTYPIIPLHGSEGPELAV
jgi:hypothetical protein